MPDLEQIARTALLEVTPETTIGAHSGTTEVDGVATITFQAAMAGYPGWHWTVGIATLSDAAPSVLEIELMPGDGALLAPDWVPWSERLAEYEAAQEALTVDETDDGLEGSEADDDADDDEDAFGSDVLHGGDLDGVDIDALDDPDDDDEDADDDVEDDTNPDDESERSY